MTRYEFSLRQEVLLEMGTSILVVLFRYGQEKNLTEPSPPVQVMYDLVGTAKRNILLTASEQDLDRITVLGDSLILPGSSSPELRQTATPEGRHS